MDEPLFDSLSREPFLALRFSFTNLEGLAGAERGGEWVRAAVKGKFKRDGKQAPGPSERFLDKSFLIRYKA